MLYNTIDGAVSWRMDAAEKDNGWQVANWLNRTTVRGWANDYHTMYLKIKGNLHQL